MDYRLDLYNAVENFQQQMTDGDALFIICNTKQGDLLVGLDVGINIISSVRANDNGYVNIENKEPKIVNERAKRIVLNMAINILRTDVNLLKKFDVARVSDKAQSSAFLVGDVMPRCSSCRFWRDKGWGGDEGIGMCDNPIVIKQVSMMREEIIKPFVIGDTEQHKKAHARMIANSLRFHGSFGCVHYNIT